MCTGDEEVVEEGFVIMDGNRWQDSQMIGIHLGYFWCLSDFYDFADDYRQHCERNSATMDNIRETSTSSESGSKKSGDDAVVSMINNLQIQIRESQMI